MGDPWVMLVRKCRYYDEHVLTVDDGVEMYKCIFFEIYFQDPFFLSIASLNAQIALEITFRNYKT